MRQPFSFKPDLKEIWEDRKVGFESALQPTTTPTWVRVSVKKSFHFLQSGLDRGCEIYESDPLLSGIGPAELGRQ